MSGNPYGLSSISHYGSMQRVGGKAAGFINKKFFHPSSLRNQEKLWLAQTAHERETRKQEEMEKRRVEEMQVEELRKQMYLQGQATKGTDSLYLPAVRVSGKQHLDKDQKMALDEQQRRKALLKQEKDARQDEAITDEADDACELVERTAQKAASEVDLASLAKSGYKEDVHVRGHESVWGSWYVIEDQKWGYVCCKSVDRQKRCPLAPEEVKEELSEAKGERGLRGKRRKRGGVVNVLDTSQTPPTSSSSSTSAAVANEVAGGALCGDSVSIDLIATQAQESVAGSEEQIVDQGARESALPEHAGVKADQPLEGEQT